MFGKNRVLAQDLHAYGDLAVQEIFHTIQGEGPFAGRPAVFVRLAGCNLRCFFCDTEFESNLHNRMTVGDVQTAIDRERDGAPTTLVVLTGGEPLRQNVVPLIAELNSNGMEVQIETAGTLWVPGLGGLVERGACSLVCSPKTPKVHEKVEQHCKHWKYIISSTPGAISADDGLPLLSTQVEGKMAHLFRPSMMKGGNRIWVQPCEEYEQRIVKFFPKVEMPVSHGTQNQENVKLCVKLAMNFGYSLSLQQHKLLGLP